ncbi:MAG: 16S rRNA (cytosine(1402)-N(4))-methyltransferase RsmH [Minisyncoccia bacterium]
MGHIPVLLQETIELLSPQLGDTVLDCTFNRAGHSVELAKKIGKQGTLIGFDLDHIALKEGEEILKKTLAKDLPKIILCETNFRHVIEVLKEKDVVAVDALLADLGLSSQELDVSGRGFSFQKDEPLRMTLSSREDALITADTVVNEWGQETLVDIFRAFGDESYAGRIARHIVEAREQKRIKTTKELADIIYHAVPVAYKRGKIHPATKTFQAIRMAVNDEIGALHELLESLPKVVASGGKAGFISFHSGEDRLVKNYFRDHKEEWEAVTKKPVTPSLKEQKENPRSRSAKLRVYKKI